MAGQIKATIDAIISQRSKGDPMLVMTTKAKLILKGIQPDKFTAASPDDPAVLSHVKRVASEMGVRI